MNILEVENFSVDFKTPHGLVNAVKNVSFSLKQNKIYGLVGESGSGKSQLFFL